MSKKEVGRQMFHVFLGILLVLYLELLGIDRTATLLFVLLIVGLVLSYTSKRVKVPGINRFLTWFDREEDLRLFPGRGAITFVIGCLLAVLLFEKNIAMASIIILSFLDSFSTLGGKRFGKTKHPLHHHKTLEGSLFGFIVSFFAVVMFIHPIKALLACFLATLVEMTDLIVDDNILIPVVAGIIMMIPI